MTKSGQPHFRSWNTLLARISIFIAFSLLIGLTSTPSTFAQKTQHYEDAHRTYKRALEQFEQNNYITAKRLFEQVVSYVPPSTREESYILRANAEYYIALCALKMDQPEAEELFRTYIKNYHETPNTRKAYYQLGKYHYRQREYDEAIKWLTKVDIYDMSNDQIAKYKFILGYCYFYNQKLDKAKNLFRQIINIENKYYYSSNYYYGFILFKKGNYDQALSSFQKISDSYRYKRVVPYYISQIYFMQGKYNKLLSYAPDKLERNRLRNRMKLNHLIGQAYFEKKQHEKALPYLRKYVDNTDEVRKKDLYQLAYTQYKTGHVQDAVGNFKELNYLKDTMGHNSLYMLGSCYLKTDQRDKARNAFGQAAKLDYDSFIKEKAVFNYAKLSYELDYNQIAVNQLQRYVENYPEGESIKEAKELLTEGFLNSNNYRQALSLIESMDEMTPKIKKAYQQVAYSLGVEHYKNNNRVKAARSFNNSLDHPINQKYQALAHFWNGEIYYNEGDMDLAIESHRKFLELANVTNHAKVQSHVKHANYTLGYCFFKQEQYENALAYLENCINQSQKAEGSRKHKRLNTDATLRKGDCHFVLKDYKKALVAYNNIALNKGPNADYALYQKGIIQGLIGDYKKKIKTLNQLNDQYSQSLYNDDAILEIATTYQNIDKPDEAISKLKKLIDEYPQSQLIRKAYLKLGLIYYNNGDDQKALKNYKLVAKNYPESEEAKDALLAIKDISINMNKPEIYMDLLESTSGSKVSTSAKDSVLFRAAEKKYIRNDCDNAIKGLDKYLNQFPDGAFALKAHFYRGECRYRKEQYKAALKDYEYVAGKSVNRFTEDALVKASKLNYQKFENYQNAYKAFQRLYDIASSKDNQFNALVGMMQSAYKVNKHQQAKNHAQKVLKASNASEEDIAEAHYIIARSYKALGDTSKAFQAFKKTSQATDSEKGIEAKYNIARVHFQRGELDSAKSKALAIKNHVPYYEDWVVRSFILLADIFVEKDNLFQAKATLQSIQDNYEGDNKELIDRANKKLSSIEKLEKEKSKVIDESKKDTSTMEMDTTQELEPEEER